jgi:CRP/FNR family transcriptional regulator
MTLPEFPCSRPTAAHRPSSSDADGQAPILGHPVLSTAETLAIVGEVLAPARRIVHAGTAVYRAGDVFANLYVMNSGFFKVVNLASDGREQVVALKFRGDWLGFDGIADGRHACDSIALDTGEVWAIGYEALLQAAVQRPALLAVLHEAMSRELANGREWLVSVCTLPSEARVAAFLSTWTESLALQGMRTDQLTLRMTRGEIGSSLGLNLETVCRAMTRLEREGLIVILGNRRREIHIPDPRALAALVDRHLASAAPRH